MMRDEHSWNHGLVRGPMTAAASRSIRRRARCCRDAVRPTVRSRKCLASAPASISPIAASQATMARRMARISSGDLISRAFSITASPLPMEMPSRASSSTPSGLRWSTAMRLLPPPCSLHQIGDAGGPAADLLLGQFAAIEIHPRHGRPHLVDDAGMVGQMLAGEIVEQHHRAFGGDETMPRRIVRHPQLHVGRVGGVADVDGVVEQGAGIVAALQLGADALQPVFAHRRQVGRGDACRRPFRLSLRAIAQHMLVERRRLLAGGVAQGLDRAGSNGMILRWRRSCRVTPYPPCKGEDNSLIAASDILSISHLLPLDRATARHLSSLR